VEYVGDMLIDLEEVDLLIHGNEGEETGIQKDVDDFRLQNWDLAMAFWECNLRK